MPITTDDASPIAIRLAIPAIARQHRLTGYDATYLELALRESIPLATLDVELKRAAKEDGVAVLPEKSLNHDANMKTATVRMKNGGQWPP